MRTVTPYIPLIAGRRIELLSRAAFGAAVIPLLKVGGHVVLRESGELCGFHGTRQIARVDVARRETVRERGAQPFARGSGLLAPHRRERDVRAAGVLAGLAPPRLSMAEQYQLACRFHDGTVFSLGNKLVHHFTVFPGRTRAHARISRARTARACSTLVHMARKLKTAPDLSMATAKPVQSAHTRDTNEKLANLDNTTKETVQRIDKVNNKITDLREQRMRDPDTLGDKAFKLAFPALIGMVAGKAFQSVWNLVTNKVHPSPNDDEADRKQGLLMSVLFAAASAAFSTVVTT